MFLIRDGDNRYLVLGKTRFEPLWPELKITSYTAQVPAMDEFGHTETIVMRWGIAAPAQTSRKEASEQAAERQKKEDEANLRQDVRDAVEIAWALGNPLNRGGVKAKVHRKNSDVGTVLEILLNERWLHEVDIPSKERTNSKRSAFLVNLTTEEHEAVLRGEGLPSNKLVIPDSWKRPIPSVPTTASDSMEVDHVES